MLKCTVITLIFNNSTQPKFLQDLRMYDKGNICAIFVPTKLLPFDGSSTNYTA